MNHANTLHRHLAPLFVGGTVLLSSGVALAQQPPALDAAKEEAPPLAPTRPPSAVYGQNQAPEPSWVGPPPPQHYSRGMMYAGIVITCLGIATVPVGLAMLALPSSGDFPTGPVAAVGIMSIGAFLPVIGAPLWAVGGHTPAVPKVAAGPRGVTLRWTF
jgi:hypothetical protein